MKNIAIIHPPGDETTSFLTAVYRDRQANAIEIDDRYLNDYLRNNRVLAMGHGSPNGLYNADYRTVLHSEHVDALSGSDNIYIWCYASLFAARYGLKGFATGMFISEPKEAMIMGIEATPEEIDLSNTVFTSVLRESLHLDGRRLYEAVMDGYDLPGNKVVEYNKERMACLT